MEDGENRVYDSRRVRLSEGADRSFSKRPFFKRLDYPRQHRLSGAHLGRLAQVSISNRCGAPHPCFWVVGAMIAYGISFYCLITVPSRLRISPHPPFRWFALSVKGNFAASFSSISMPHPGRSFTQK
jgi:hypothetical protein